MFKLNKFSTRTTLFRAFLGAVIGIIIAFFAVVIFSGDSGAIKYSITRYDGNLELADQDASFTQELTYKFDSTYNGQYITLGKAGHLPSNAEIRVQSVQVNGLSAVENAYGGPAHYEVENASDAIILRIYNGGNAGDTVKLKIVYQLSNFTFRYVDGQNLNWVPISDWDVPINNVHFTLTTQEIPKTAKFAAHLGYLNQAIQPIQKGKSVSISVRKINKGSDLQLNNFWSKEAFPVLTQNTDGSGLVSFNNRENGVVTWVRTVNLWVYYFFPLLLLGLLIFLIWRTQAFFKRVTPKTSYDDKLRLYQLPDDLAPLLVASNVYSVELDEVSTGNDRSAFSFSNMILATMTDLIDRGRIKLNEDQTLTKVSAEGVSDFEKAAVDMVFGDEETISFDEAFYKYKMSPGRFVSQEDRRDEGVKMKADFEKDKNEIGLLVTKAVENKNLPPRFRKLTVGESSGLFFRGIAFILIGLAAIGVGFMTYAKTYFPVQFGFTALMVAIAIFALFYWGAVSSRTVVFSRDGVLTDEGAIKQNEWNAFANMLRDIAHLDDDQLNTIQLWNRLLVFATLFGFADQVIKLMNTRGIQLEGNLGTMNTGFYYPFYYGLGGSLNSAVTGFTNAANIHIDSGSGGFGGGGFGGGGFSGGGGGGGGGGAF